MRPYNTRKLQFRSSKCVFLGYSSIHKGYKCLHVLIRRVYIPQDVVFNEHVFPFQTNNAQSSSPHSTSPTVLPSIHTQCPNPLLVNKPIEYSESILALLPTHEIADTLEEHSESTQEAANNFNANQR